MPDTVAVHHVIDGPDDAPVVVLANSLGTTLRMWDPQAPELARRFRLLRYDHRGHGGSPVVPGPYGVDDLGADLLALLDGLTVDPARMRANLAVEGDLGAAETFIDRALEME